MCGRYASSRRPEDLVEEFEVDRVVSPRPLEADFNVAPTKQVYAVFDRVPRDAPADTPAERRLATVVWGLVPSWAKDRTIGSRLINARVETLAEKPAFRRAFARRRCLLPADGYYEWYVSQALDDEGASAKGNPAKGKAAKVKAAKQPFFITPPDEGVLAMAGLYEIWRDRAVPEDHENAFVWSATVITTTAEDSLGHIHDRMPMLVEPSGYDAWLDASVTAPEHLTDVLVPAAPGRLRAYPVSTAVNNHRNNGAALIAPLRLEGEPPPGDQPRGDSPPHDEPEGLFAP